MIRTALLQREAAVLRAVLVAGLICAAPVFGQDEGADPQSGEDTQPVVEDPQDGGDAESVEPPPLIGEPLESDGDPFPLSAVNLQYVKEIDGQPPIDTVMQMTIELGRTERGFVAARDDVTPASFVLADMPLETFYASAIQAILEQIRDHFSDLGFIGVFIAPDPVDITTTGVDRRTAGDTELGVLITIGIVTEMRTIGTGERLDPMERIDNPVHQRIKDNSPVQPYKEGDEERKDLLRKDEIDRYIYHLSRHPGRSVDIGLAAGTESGGAELDYLINENRPLTLYAQTSNTGTAETSRWRLRFGLLHSQLTNADDILGLEYSTTGFDDTYNVAGIYSRPFSNDRIRWRVFGGYSEYTASDVGAFLDIFTGDTLAVSAEIVANVYQHQDLFIDVFGGARFEDIRVNNQAFQIEGDENFLIPYVGGRMERGTLTYSSNALLAFEFQNGDITGVDDAGLDALGRTSPDRNWVKMKWDARHSFYLEPVLNRAAWEDPTTPESSTLAHEIALRFSGQYAFDYRLIPQEQQVVGGLYTVRGYPQSLVAGDSVIFGSVEYRFHIPRALEINPEPGELFGETFRWTPQQPYGFTDWDLILKAFLDAGVAIISDALPFESNETLVGAGIGLEVNYRRNARFRVDWGWALNAIETRGVDAGDSEVHMVATLLF